MLGVVRLPDADRAASPLDDTLVDRVHARDHLDEGGGAVDAAAAPITTQRIVHSFSETALTWPRYCGRDARQSTRPLERHQEVHPQRGGNVPGVL
jgi:hypothetical protein